MFFNSRSFILIFVSICTFAGYSAEYSSKWHLQNNQVWLGEDLWANPMENWRVQDGRLECIRSRESQNVQLMTHEIIADKAEFKMSVISGVDWSERTAGWFGFMLGIKSELVNPKHRLIFGKATLHMGVRSDNKIYIAYKGKKFETKVKRKSREYKLECLLKPTGETYSILLKVHDAVKKDFLGQVEVKNVSTKDVLGNIALASHLKFSFNNWFKNWQCSGNKLKAFPDRTFGPILWTQHSLSRGIMKMTVQMPPISLKENPVLSLQTRPQGQKNWSIVARSNIIEDSRTAHFRLKNWNDSLDTEYRVTYTSKDVDGKEKVHYYKGTIRRDPVDRNSVSLAGFTGCKDYIFPNEDLAKRVDAKNPDILFFSGDQLYEGNGGYGIYRQSVELATLNYLRKWYLFGWSFRDLMRDRVSLIIPDDHDVFQGNIWGEGGKGVPHIRDHNKGGYAMDAKWVNMVQRTQTWHHPDAYDPTPVEQDIGVYYGDMVYGRVSFAIIEDRKFKSGPAGKVNTWKGRPDHVKDIKYDVSKLDKFGLKLLGNRQLSFLNHWSVDWGGADMKAVLSATIFANVANYHGSGKMYLLADLDSNGWPQTGRNKALKEIRRGFGFMIAGDQHLASIVQHGVDEFDDAGFSFCVPSVAAGYPRSWIPKKAAVESFPGLPKYTGKYYDGLKNKISVWAVGNPENTVRSSLLEALHDRASGFGLVHFDKRKREIKMECFRLLNDKNGKELQFPGWPKTIHMLDNYKRSAKAWLPTLTWKSESDPVLQVIEEKTGETLYSLRLFGNSFEPKVFAEGTYTVRIGEPGAKSQKTLRGIKAAKTKGASKLSFEL